MKFIVNGNVSLKDYLNTNIWEEMSTHADNVFNESVKDIVEDDMTNVIATEGLFSLAGSGLKAGKQMFNITSLVARSGVQLATLGAKKTAEILKLLNNSLQNNLPKLITKIQSTLENTEALYMRLMKYDQKFLEVANRVRVMLTSKSYTQLKTVPTTTIRFYKVNGELFKNMIDLIGDYHLLCRRVVGLEISSSNITQITGGDVLFGKGGNLGAMVTPGMLMKELKGVNLKSDLNNVLEILKKASDSLGAYMTEMTKDGPNTILKKYVQKFGDNGRLLTLNDGPKDDAQKEIKKLDKNKGVGENPVKKVLLPVSKTYTFDVKNWTDQRKQFAKFIEQPAKDGGMVQAFVLIINGVGTGETVKTTSSVVVDLIKRGGASVKRSTDLMVKKTKTDIEALRKFMEEIKKVIDESLRANNNIQRDNRVEQTHNIKNGKNVNPGADTGVGGHNKPNNMSDSERKSAAMVEDDLKLMVDIMNAIEAYLRNWYAILERVGGFYTQIASGLLGAIYNITNEIQHVLNMVESANHKENDNIDSHVENSMRAPEEKKEEEEKSGDS